MYYFLAPPLSVDGVTTVLEGIAAKWKAIGILLCVPFATLDFISTEGGSNMERLRAVVRYWLLRDPLASWRRLMWELDCSQDCDIRAVADSIRTYAEKLIGQYSCVLNF